MDGNAFVGQAAAPTEEALKAALGSAKKALWDRLAGELATSFDLTAEWTSYSRKAGWSMRLKSGKRNIVYFSPAKKAIRVSFALGAKAVQEARASKLPAAVIAALDAAPVYAEGTGLRWEITSAKDVPVVKTLTGIKIAN